MSGGVLRKGFGLDEGRPKEGLGLKGLAVGFSLAVLLALIVSLCCGLLDLDRDSPCSSSESPLRKSDSLLATDELSASEESSMRP